MKIIIAVTLFFYSLAGYASTEPDSLVTYNRLVFFNDLEKENFNSLLKDESDYFNFLSCLDSEITAIDLERNRALFNTTLSNLKESGFKSKKPAKQIKIIYQSIHNKFFDKYELKNKFTDIFSAGKYNCVSATGLYAITFDELNIPYVIKETPTHVYIVAFPESERIVVETTTPTDGYISYNEAFKRTFVQQMKDLKLVSVSDARELSTEAIFNKYYYKDDNIDLRKLAGIQYLNDGIYLMEKEDFKTAFRQFQKSYYLYPHDRAGYSMFWAASSYLTQLNPSELSYAEFVPEYAAFAKFGITRDEIVSEFYKLTNIWLFQKSDTITYNKIYQRFQYLYKDSVYQRDIRFGYYYEFGRYLTQGGRKEKALTYVKKAYAVNPANLQVQSFLIHHISNKVARINSADRILILLEETNSEFPDLANNPNFTNLLLSVYLQMAHKSFYENSGNRGVEYLKKFENLYTSLDESDIIENAIGIAYSSAAMYYYRKGYKTKAREQLNTGLKLSPNNQLLEQRLKYIK
jgi:hypothetical protein